jgi:polysaccharide pyruvyl transferase WcaK-like protein
LVDAAILSRNLKDVIWPLRRLRRRSVLALKDEKRFLILPSNPEAPVSSMGDVAMLSGLIQSLRTQYPPAGFTLVGTGRQITLSSVGSVDVVSALYGSQGSVTFDRLVREHHAVFWLGADVIDGNYGAALVCRFAAYCNHAAQLGIPATIVGFSFNRRPRMPAAHALSRLHVDVRVNVRDQPSLERFSKSVGIPAELCADVAFLMPPAPQACEDTERWIEEMRSIGRIPVGININAHAFRQVIAHIGTDALIVGMAAKLAAAGERSNLAFLLIPHDVKPEAGDSPLLRSLERTLGVVGFPYVRYAQILDPPRIKRLAGLLEVVVTGRMHLAIASLGMQTPIISITYQDKFEGLHEHFDLPAGDVIQPGECLTDELSVRISEAIARRVSTRKKIGQSLPRVTELARRNLLMGR